MAFGLRLSNRFKVNILSFFFPLHYKYGLCFLGWNSLLNDATDDVSRYERAACTNEAELNKNEEIGS